MTRGNETLESNKRAIYAGLESIGVKFSVDSGWGRTARVEQSANAAARRAAVCGLKAAGNCSSI